MKEQHLPDSTASRIQALRNRHAVLSARIERAHSSLATKDLYLRELKKERLSVKDEIEDTIPFAAEKMRKV